MEVVVHADVVLAGEDTYALVSDIENIRALRQTYRLCGVAEITGSATGGNDTGDNLVIRLTLEEIYVGLVHGFLELVSTVGAAVPRENAVDYVDSVNGIVCVDAFCRELLQQASGDDAIASWTLDPMRRSRLCVFRDLWEKHYFVAFGSKFGADFLIYNEDPASSHALAIIVVKDYTAPFQILEIASHCRMAQMVKKDLLFAAVASPTLGEMGIDRVEYISLTHALLVSCQEL